MYQSFINALKIHLHNFVELLHLANAKTVFTKLVLLLIAIFAPVAPIIHAVLFLIMVDLIIGIFAAHKNKELITSSKLSRTISKLFVYITTILVTHIVSTYLLFGLGLSLTTIVAGFIAITELKSILENLNKLSGQTALKDVILYLSNERNRKILGPKMCKDCPVLKNVLKTQKKLNKRKKK